MYKRQQYNVPGGNGTNLCWVACDAMWISYLLGDTTDRTLNIAIAAANDMVMQGLETLNADGSLNYNVARPWQSADYVAGLLGISEINEAQNQSAGALSMANIQTEIDAGNPFSVLYGSFYMDEGVRRWSGHWVLGIGYASAPGHEPLVVSNDPAGGEQRIQTYDDFRGNYVGDPAPWRPWAESAR